MSKQWQIRRGTTAENNEFTGAIGEITMDTQTQGLRIHDGTTQGGHMIDTVVDFQIPTAENNYTWYRKYASGWVEQGGVSVYTSDADYTVSLPVEMTDTNYTILTTVAPLGSPYTNTVGANRMSAFNLTTISFQLRGDTSATMQRRCWQVSGMAA